MNRKETPKPPAQSLPESPAQPATEASASNLPKAYDPSAIEQRWAEYWVRERLFDVPTPATEPGAPSMERSDMGGNSKENFTLLLPPPNVTGRLHMGHMLNQTEMDILTRWHRMRGQTSLWVPGTDHAGIATQMMVERQLASVARSSPPASGSGSASTAPPSPTRCAASEPPSIGRVSTSPWTTTLTSQ
jgi:isoleucyl-tRNA synthetase